MTLKPLGLSLEWKQCAGTQAVHWDLLTNTKPNDLRPYIYYLANEKSIIGRKFLSARAVNFWIGLDDNNVTVDIIKAFRRREISLRYSLTVVLGQTARLLNHLKSLNSYVMMLYYIALYCI